MEKELDNLVKELKSNNIWDKMLYIYPFIGNSKPNKIIYNLKDIPRYRRIDKLKKIYQI